MTPPMPMPVIKRSTTSCGMLVAKTQPSEDTARNTRLATSTGLRPRRSPAGPDSRAPTMMPTLDITKVLAKAAAGMCQASRNAGAAMPIALIS